LNDAVIQGASGRLRPVLMTTMTTIFAVLPMALAVGDGSEVYAPLGQAIFGGMLTSTAITLFIVPVLYRFMEQRKATRRRSSGRAASFVTVLLVTAGVLTGPTPAGAQEAVDSLRDEAARQSSRLGSLIVFDADHFPAEPDGSFMEKNREISLQEGELRAARADHRGAVARRFPTVSARADAAWLANPTDPVTLEAGELGTIPFSENPMLGMDDILLPDEETRLFEGSGDTRYELGLSLVQPIFAWGTIEGAVAAAEAAERLAATRLAGTRHAVTIEAAAAAETVAILGAVQESLALQAEAAERLVSISRENWSNGFITEREYLDARLARQEVLLALAEVAEQRGNALEGLRILTGRTGGEGAPGRSAAPLQADPPRAGGLPMTEEELIRRATRGSWELLALEEGREFRRAREGIAAGSRTLRPDVGFRLDLSWAGALEDAGESQWEDRGEWQVTVGVGISATLFDGGRAGADHARAIEESRLAELEALDREERLAGNIRNRLRKVETLKAGLEHTAVVLSVRAREVSDAEAARDAGAGGEADVLRALMDQARAVSDGYSRLAAYRSELWALAAGLGAEAFR
jgi:outer membrane protein TolC